MSAQEVIYKQIGDYKAIQKKTDWSHDSCIAYCLQALRRNNLSNDSNIELAINTVMKRLDCSQSKVN